MGFLHIYTGNGKGKTTAALGLALRAMGSGKNVFIGQFVKSMAYSETEPIRTSLPQITIKQYGLNCFINQIPTSEDAEAAKKGLSEIESILREAKHELVILDEANIALYYNLFNLNELIRILNCRTENTEVVITGRYAPPELIEYADLVTEMKEIKHYYAKGIKSRKGFEF